MPRLNIGSSHADQEKVCSVYLFPQLVIPPSCRSHHDNKNYRVAGSGQVSALHIADDAQLQKQLLHTCGDICQRGVDMQVWPTDLHIRSWYAVMVINIDCKVLPARH